MPTTPNMGLTTPIVGVTTSPTWALNVNSDLSIIDQHDHSSGNGVQITPAGLNITIDLPFNDNNATTLRSSRYTSQGSPLSLVTDIGCTYVSGADLYYNDTIGNQIRLTQSGSIVSALSVDNITLQNISNVLSIKSLGVGTSQLAANAVTAAKIANSTITGSQMASNNNIPGNNVLINSMSAVVAGRNLSKNVILAYGQCDSSGNFLAGAPTPAATSNPSTGSFTVSFSSGTFSANAIGLAAATNASNCTATISASTVNVYNVNILQSNLAANAAFTYILIGPSS